MPTFSQSSTSTFNRFKEVAHLLFDGITKIVNEDDTDKYSASDCLVQTVFGNYIVELKTRNAVYPTMMLEVDKYQRLREKAATYVDKGVKIEDVLYINFYKDDVYKWSFKELRKDIVYEKIQMTTEFCPSHTASNGNNAKKLKYVYMLPIKDKLTVKS